MAGSIRAAPAMAAVAGALAICGAAVGRDGAERCPIDQLGRLRRSFEAAMRWKDRDQVLRLYGPDAVFFDEVSRRLEGRAQLEGLYATVFARYDSHLRLTPDTIAPRRHGARLVCDERGHFTEALRDRRSGRVQRAQGPYRFAYARETDGAWRFVLMDWRPGPGDVTPPDARP